MIKHRYKGYIMFRVSLQTVKILRDAGNKSASRSSLREECLEDFIKEHNLKNAEIIIFYDFHLDEFEMIIKSTDGCFNPTFECPELL
jgi:hypothetical protein